MQYLLDLSISLYCSYPVPQYSLVMHLYIVITFVFLLNVVVTDGMKCSFDEIGSTLDD
jgi:hypothetical protein